METNDTLSSCSNSEEQQMQQIQDKAKESCMVSFRRLHSHLKLLSKNDLKGTRTESRFKRAFATLFSQDVETFTCTMFLNMDQLEKQLDKEEFQETRSMVAFKVLETQFQMFIKSRIYLDDEYVVMTRNYFLQYTQLKIREFRDTLIQHMEYVKKSIDKRALHKREYDSRVNERQMQTTEESSGNDVDADDADIKPVYDEEPMAEVQLTAKSNVLATGQQHTEQPEFNNEEEVNQNAEKCHDTCPLPKCVFNANHDTCVTKFLNEVNSRAKVPSYKTTKRYKPVEQMSIAKKPERQIATGHRFSIKKTSSMLEKTIIPRSCLRWKQTGRIFKTVGLRWVPTGKIFTSSTTNVDSEPINGSNEDITNQYECEHTLDVSASTLNLSAGTSFNPKKEGLRIWLMKRLISQKPGLQGILI
ncbi:hypothetical protein Tco_1010032 [Tanacetum coccineum]